MSKIVVLFVFIFSGIFAQSVEDIHTDKDVQNFFKLNFKSYKNFQPKSYHDYEQIADVVFKDKSCKIVADSLGNDIIFFKDDLNNDGKLDLITNGTLYNNFEIFAAVSGRDGSYNLHNLVDEIQKCSYIAMQPKHILRLFVKKTSNFDNPYPQLTYSDLIYKFDGFVEVNKNIKRYKINKIEYYTTSCLGICPEFLLTIYPNRTVVKKLKHEKVLPERNGVISKKEYKSLLDILNYTDFPNLEDKYSVSATDHRTIYLKVYYNDTKIKEIKDYGAKGTFGLARLYLELDNIAESIQNEISH